MEKESLIGSVAYDDTIHFPGKLADLIVEQQNAVLAMLAQGTENAQRLHSAQSAALDQIAELRKELRVMEDSIVLKVQRSMAGGLGNSLERSGAPDPGRSKWAGSLNRSGKISDLLGRSSDTPGDPLDRPGTSERVLDRWARALGSPPAGCQGDEQPPYPSPRSCTASANLPADAAALLGTALVEQTDSLARARGSAASVEAFVSDRGHAAFVDSCCGDDLLDAMPSPEEVDFIHGMVIETPAHAIEVPVCGRTIPLVQILDWISCIIVLANAVFTAIMANYAMKLHFRQRPVPEWLLPVEVVFTVMFTVEFLLRWYLWGRVFFTGHERGWNVFDMLCVFTSLMDTLVMFFNLSFMRLVRLFRVMRVLRALRGLRAVRDLRFLLAMIIASGAAFMWGFIMLASVVFIFAIILLQTLDISAEYHGSEISQDIYDHYGTVYVASMSLIKAVTGGENWGLLLRPLAELSWTYTVFYLVYIAVIVNGVMNILIAVFCERAAQIKRADPGLAIQDEMERIKHDRQHLKKFFSFADLDNDGVVSLRELEQFFSCPRRRAMLNLLHIDVAEARGLFELLDDEKKSSVDLNTYVDAIMRLKGAAKGCDTAMLLVENKRLLLRLSCFMYYTHSNFHLLFEQLGLQEECHTLAEYISRDFLASKDGETKEKVRAQLCAHLGSKAEDIKVKPRSRKPLT